MNREKVIANLSAEVNRLMNANIRLEEERADIWRRNRDTESSRDTKAAIIAEIKAENESLRADADRYRWIKKESNLSDYEDCYSLPMVHAWEYKPGPELNEQFESLDAAIDHAISSPENP